MGKRQELPLYDVEFIKTKTDDADSSETHAALFQFDAETGQTSFDVLDHVLINSETPRVIQFQGKLLGRSAVVALFNKRNHWGDMVVTTNHKKH